MTLFSVFRAGFIAVTLLTTCRKGITITKNKPKGTKPVTTTRVVTPTEVKTKVFAYGTLNLHEIQRHLWGEAMQGTPFTLDDYELKSYQNNIFYIEKRFGERVVGKVYELNQEQLERTDWYEGEAYRRDKVTQDGKVIETYVKA